MDLAVGIIVHNEGTYRRCVQSAAEGTAGFTRAVLYLFDNRERRERPLEEELSGILEGRELRVLNAAGGNLYQYAGRAGIIRAAYADGMDRLVFLDDDDQWFTVEEERLTEDDLDCGADVGVFKVLWDDPYNGEDSGILPLDGYASSLEFTLDVCCTMWGKSFSVPVLYRAVEEFRLGDGVIVCGEDQLYMLALYKVASTYRWVAKFLYWYDGEQGCAASSVVTPDKVRMVLTGAREFQRKAAEIEDDPDVLELILAENEWYHFQRIVERTQTAADLAECYGLWVGAYGTGRLDSMLRRMMQKNSALASAPNDANAFILEKCVETGLPLPAMREAFIIVGYEDGHEELETRAGTDMSALIGYLRKHNADIRRMMGAERIIDGSGNVLYE